MRVRNNDRGSVPTRRPCCSTRDCPSCRDNARWERIFQQKFSDPNYYARDPLRSSSPISEL
jgi:hypothetical protein